MKISRIIIISFAVFVIGSLLILFIDSKNHKKDEVKGAQLKSFPLHNFSVVVAEKSSDVHLNQSDKNEIAVEFLKDKLVKKQMFKLLNDTLYVYGGLRTFVDCKKIKSLIVHKAFWLGVNNFKLDSLNIDVTGGQVIFSANDKDKTNIGLMNMNVRDTASIEVSKDVVIDDICINATDKSNLRLFGKYTKADVRIKEKTELFFNDAPLSLKLERDKYSIIHIY